MPPNFTPLSEEQRLELWQALLDARDRSGRPTHYELHSELNAYCVLAALRYSEIIHLMRYSSTPLEQAIARMAYRLATQGMPLHAE